MVLYSFYIFDRHTECIYSRRWTPTRPASSSSKAPRPTSNASTLSDPNGDTTAAQKAKYADDEKLIFGLVFSLRNMVQKLGGQDDTFLSYRTGEYKLHYYETPTRMKFVMLTDTKLNNLRPYLHQIWANLYVEYVVKNPLAPVEHPGGIGVANELFERALELFVTSVLPA
ncbi:Trafficking protein particle complex subunit BET5 [Didymosphaeria variabile]|uniref:Trafficking protein particle complex subunit n=2 Tax=Didymosphaeriaceae TaxID=221678 RepID=A0A9W8XL48_9PLEO|nr:Trafficking protein particle complex subunit BET5 [Didymosphaeria variabile]KAJ4353776.1 Trafficking protein particle complex subunit BET5 [Didymosphaeria variabile]